MTWVLIHMAATWAMVGFIWTIQLLNYPLMGAVGEPSFSSYEVVHQRRVVAVLAVFAPLELISAAAIAIGVSGVPSWLSMSAGAVLALVWLSTGVYFGPVHGRLAHRFDALLHRKLVRHNWFRTLAWSLRGGAALVMVAMVASGSN
jgi:hypothetical protein